MNGELMLYLDQFGSKYFAATIAELREAVGSGRVGKMYCDLKDGEAVHVGYVIGRHWLEAFRPVRNAA